MKIILILFILISSLFANKQINQNLISKKIVFINPGKSDEKFWLNVSKFMQAAAEDLNFELTIHYAQRNHYKMIGILQNILNEKTKPDFLIIVNENNMADKLLKMSKEENIKTLLILNDLSEKQKEEFGKPREKIKNWIGTIIPDNIQAGYLIAKTLIDKKPNDNINMVAINGDESTFAARHRYKGLQKALIENPQVELKQKFIADWNEDLSNTITKRVLKRHPNINVIWAANDPMALGAIKAIKDENKNILVSGLNWSQEAMNAIHNDELVASVGGHYMIGGWSIVLLYDYLYGNDFIHESLELKQNIFGIINKRNYKQYIKYFKDENYSTIDFRKFSKTINPQIKKYNFSLDEILKQLK